jgi:hypothetical protein
MHPHFLASALKLTVRLLVALNTLLIWTLFSEVLQQDFSVCRHYFIALRTYKLRVTCLHFPGIDQTHVFVAARVILLVFIDGLQVPYVSDIFVRKLEPLQVLVVDWWGP